MDEAKIARIVGIGEDCSDRRNFFRGSLDRDTRTAYAERNVYRYELSDWAIAHRS
jgi:hypothetical protein